MSCNMLATFLHENEMASFTFSAISPVLHINVLINFSIIMLVSGIVWVQKEKDCYYNTNLHVFQSKRHSRCSVGFYEYYVSH